MHNLVIALFKLLVDVDIFYIKTGIVLEPLLGWPVLADALLRVLRDLLGRHVLNLGLFLNVVHGVGPLKVVCPEFKSAYT